MTPTSDHIQRLAPGAQVLAAGQKLGKPVQWLGLGRHGNAIWGECRGSALYQVCVDTVEVAYSCSCPSRKHPCKHVVGLLTLFYEQEEAVADSTPPDWVTAWLTRHSARLQRVEAAPSSGAPPRTRTIPQAERRAKEREARMLDGIEALELWMCDLVRNGLATVETQPPAFWQHQAARLVDAGLPGLASWLRRLSIIPGSTPQWPERLLGEFGRLELLLWAHRRIDRLDLLLQYDVRALLGQHLTKEQVSATGDHVTDAWVALGASVEDDEQLRVQRTWLRGLRTGRSAMVLQFAVGKATTFPWVATVNHVQEMELHFWPSAWPQRAFIARRLNEPVYSKDRRPGHATIEDMLAEVAQGLAVNPWIDRTCAVLRDVVPIRQGDNNYLIRDQSGASLPLQRQSHWRMFAQSGGYPIDVHGEWNGTLFHSFAFRIAETGT